MLKSKSLKSEQVHKIKYKKKLIKIIKILD